MSKYACREINEITPYVPGEQLGGYIKLNTNESPFPPSSGVTAAVKRASKELNLYPDPESGALKEVLSARYGVDKQNIFIGNGSDEVLAFIFQAFGRKSGMAFPDLTYGFYSVYCDLYGAAKRIIPLDADYRIDVNDYLDIKETIVLANPNAQTGIALSRDEIEQIVCRNPDRLVIIDEAYIDFGGESAVPLLAQYDNLIVVSTFSKSRSLAGARVGYCFSSSELIADVNKVKYSFNSYNVNRLSEAAAVAAITDDDYYMTRAKEIAAIRERFKNVLSCGNVKVTDSKGNFVLVYGVEGKALYEHLKSAGFLVRYLGGRASDAVRISIGKSLDMERLAKIIIDYLNQGAQL